LRIGDCRLRIEGGHRLKADADSLAARLRAAVERHQAGELAAAEREYREILRVDPHHADAEQLLAVVLHQSGRSQEAVGLLGELVARNPDRTDCLRNLAVVAESVGNTEKLRHSLQRLVQRQSDDPVLWFRLGNVQKELGEQQAAVDAFRRAIGLNPSFAEAHFNLANTLQQRGELESAERHFREAIHFVPEFIPARNNLGTLLQGLGRLDEAKAMLIDAAARQPDCNYVLNNLGNVLRELRETEQAVNAYRRAITHNPQSAEAHDHLAVALRDLGELAEAESAGRTAVHLSPNNPKAWNNLGNVLFDRFQFDDAISCYERAVELDSSFALPACNRALVHLLRGDFRTGWAAYESRWRLPNHRLPDFSQPRWDGSDLNGRTILLDWEQGLGDTLQFVRYAELVKQRGGRVIVRCQRPLVQLLQSVPGIDVIVPDGTNLPDFDTWSPLLSLPGILHTTEQSLPTNVPYLHPEPERLRYWRQRLAAENGFLIGIAWQGNPAHRCDRFRSIPLAEFAPVANIPGVRLVGLQKGVGAEQIRDLGERFSVLDLSDELDEQAGPFVDTAAVMRLCHLVISADTCLAHLAGALAVPVCVAMCRLPEWRWLHARDDSPWYPTMRLYRQRRLGDWGEVFHRLAEEIRHVVQAVQSPIRYDPGIAAESVRSRSATEIV